MLYQILVNQPAVIVQIVKNTPTWVWGLAAGLAMLGLSQARARTASLARTVAMPVLMLGFSAWGIASAFGNSAHVAGVLLAWLAAAVAVGFVVSLGSAPQGATYDAARQTFALPGTMVPLALILGIFLTKYAVGVELAMQPKIAADATFAMEIAALYGVFNGLFAGRALRLLKLAFGAQQASQGVVCAA